MKDLAKRKRVMQRSMRLGHCICDAKKACPCDVLQQQDVCPCAGEKLDGHAGPVRLMNLVESAGCASKIDQATLGRVLAGLPFLDDPRVLVGAPAGDDAGVYRLADDLALVQTVDVFSPSTDDPYLFGQIAAANSLSDVYAMGGRPITALSIVGFPLHTVPDEVLQQILRGGVDKMAEAGVAVIGGHSINDKEIKAGFAVTGLVHPEQIVTNAGARPGDRLILTKPLGTGIMAFAAQIGRAPHGGPEAAAKSMAMLNDRAAKLMVECGAHACTDVTGFGLLGHLAAMAEASQVDLEIVWDDLPLLPGVLECLAGGIASGAVERNRDSSGHCLIADDNIEPAMLDLCFDPQTSGGLLIAIADPAAADLLGRLQAAGIAEAAMIGRVLGAGLRPRTAPHRRDGGRFPPTSTTDNRGDRQDELLRGPSSLRSSIAERCRRRHGDGAEVPGVSGDRRRARRAGRKGQAGHRHRPFRAGPMRAVREKPYQEGPRNGLLAGRDRRGRLAGHLVWRIAHMVFYNAVRKA